MISAFKVHRASKAWGVHCESAVHRKQLEKRSSECKKHFLYNLACDLIDEVIIGPSYEPYVSKTHFILILFLFLLSQTCSHLHWPQQPRNLLLPLLSQPRQPPADLASPPPLRPPRRTSLSQDMASAKTSPTALMPTPMTKQAFLCAPVNGPIWGSVEPALSLMTVASAVCGPKWVKNWFSEMTQQAVCLWEWNCFVFFFHSE